MSGYLHKLATRALGQHAAAKPRVTPLFGEAALGPIDGCAAAALDDSAVPDDSERRPNVSVPAPAQPMALAHVLPARDDAAMVKPAGPRGEHIPPVLSVATTHHHEATSEAERSVEMPRHSTESALPIEAPLTHALPQRHDPDAAEIQRESSARLESVAVTAQIGIDRPAPRPSASTADGMPVSRAATAPAQTGLRLRAERALSIDATKPAPRTAAARVSIEQEVDVPSSGVAVIALQAPRTNRATEPMSSITDRRGASSIPSPAQAPGRPVVEPSTVNVTIGRVEVRATAAPAPAPRQRAPSTPTDLELYLQRRSKGARS